MLHSQITKRLTTIKNRRDASELTSTPEVRYKFVHLLLQESCLARRTASMLPITKDALLQTPRFEMKMTYQPRVRHQLFFKNTEHSCANAYSLENALSASA